MLRDKDIKDLSEIESPFVHKHKKEEYFTKMIDVLKIGKLFENTKDSIVELKLHEQLITLLIAILDIISHLFKGADSEELLTTIINDDKAFEQIKLLIKPPEIFGKQVA